MTRPRVFPRQDFARQQGQALVEALLMLPLMALLIWAITWLGDLQWSAQRVAQLSRKAAMSSALGQPVNQVRAAGPVDLRGSSTALSGVAPRSVATLQDEWFGTGLQMLSVQAQMSVQTPGQMRAQSLAQPRVEPQTQTIGLSRGLLPAPLIRRYTRVVIGAGHAQGDADMQRRIANAPTAWRQAQRASAAEARRVGAAARRMDGPWGRPELSLDWVAAWNDVVPADRLGKRGGTVR